MSLPVSDGPVCAGRALDVVRGGSPRGRTGQEGHGRARSGADDFVELALTQHTVGELDEPREVLPIPRRGERRVDHLAALEKRLAEAVSEGDPYLSFWRIADSLDEARELPQMAAPRADQ